MRLLLTADLHFNHAHSRPLAEEIIGRMSEAGGDAVVLVGDSAIAEGDSLERCLECFRFSGEKCFIAGNHELWTHGRDSYGLFNEELPRRVRAMGWRWLQSEPWITDRFALLGTIGWYDYSFAAAELGIPRRFYEHKISPGAAERLSEFAPLLADDADITPAARQIVARWNDGRHIKLGRSDEAFLDELLQQLRDQLQAVRHVPRVIVASHHLPFAELLPPRHNAQWDFARAFLGSGRIGALIQQYPNVSDVFCGHSHLATEAQIGPIRTVNIGAGYRHKWWRELEV